MAKVKSRQAVNFLKDVNDMAKLITGRSIPDLMGRGMDLLGIREKITKATTSSPTGPYAVLGVREDAHDLVVKAAYRQLQKRFHPDTGLEPNDEKSKALNQALQEIEKLRGRKL